MSLYAIAYHSAYDQHCLANGVLVEPQQSLIAADGTWSTSEVITRYQRNNPGITVLSCTPAHTAAA
jgi:hypothetical protein